MKFQYEFRTPGAEYPGITQKNIDHFFGVRMDEETFPWRGSLRLPKLPEEAKDWALSNSSMAHQDDDAIDKARIEDYLSRNF